MKTATSGIFEPYQILEKKYSKFVGAKFGISCNSGTSALHLALLALSIGPGDEVIIPDFTMAAVAFAVSYVGATPVFADIQPHNFGMDPKDLPQLISGRTRAIIAVHTYGYKCDIQSIVKLAHFQKIPVIEDACECQGAVKNSPADITCWSFYKNKIIAGEEGGMITTNDCLIADKCRYYKNMAFNEKHDFFHNEVGYNYRMANSQAKLVLNSLKNFKKNFKKRREIERFYDKKFANLLTAPRRDAVWFYNITLPSKEIVDLALSSIPEARMAFKPLSSFPMYGWFSGRPNSLYASENVILLPAHPKISKKRITQIANIINKFWYENTKKNSDFIE